MQGLIRSTLMGIRRSQGQVPPDKVDTGLPVAASKPGDQQILNGYTCRRSFDSAAECVYTPNRGEVQKQEYIEKIIKTADELRNLGRKYVIRCKHDDSGESNFYKLARQAWHVGTVMLILNQDLKTRVHLSESTRTFSERLTTKLQQLYPNAKHDALLQCKSISVDPCDDTKKTGERAAHEAKKIKRNRKIRRKREEKTTDPALPGQG